MTSAHRPTFDHAKGKESRVVSSVSHKRGLASHTKLKFRTKKRKVNSEFEEPEVVENMEETGDGRKIDGITKEDIAGLISEVAEVAEVEGKENTAEVKPVDETEVKESDEDSDSDEESDSDDEEEALLREMELIKKERAEAQQKLVDEEIAARARNSNPLMIPDDNNNNDTTVKPKKSWRDRKSMANKSDKNEADRFSNDTLKSDFHKSFLDKYVR